MLEEGAGCSFILIRQINNCCVPTRRLIITIIKTVFLRNFDQISFKIDCIEKKTVISLFL